MKQIAFGDKLTEFNYSLLLLLITKDKFVFFKFSNTNLMRQLLRDTLLDRHELPVTTIVTYDQFF